MFRCEFSIIFIFASIRINHFPFRRIDLATTNGNGGHGCGENDVDDVGGANNDDSTENEPVSDGVGRGSGGGYVKRPVSMFEPRDGRYSSSSSNTNKLQQTPECRTTTSMYQMAAGGAAAANRTANDPTLPLSEEVKHRTDVVTRRIQELWTAMQECAVGDAFVPCAERIRVAVAELSAIFPNV